jgi:hypothetical protein
LQDVGNESFALNNYIAVIFLHFVPGNSFGFAMATDCMATEYYVTFDKICLKCLQKSFLRMACLFGTKEQVTDGIWKHAVKFPFPYFHILVVLALRVIHLEYKRSN